MRVFLPYYHYIAPCTTKDDISVNADCHLWRFISLDWYIGRPSYAFLSFWCPIALISICRIMFTFDGSKVDDCGRESTLLLSFSFQSV